MPAAGRAGRADSVYGRHDVNTYEAYFPDEFVRLFKMTAAVTHDEGQSSAEL
jgi:hypothetical protein